MDCQWEGVVAVSRGGADCALGRRQAWPMERAVREARLQSKGRFEEPHRGESMAVAMLAGTENST